jgi:hypothetical protein
MHTILSTATTTKLIEDRIDALCDALVRNYVRMYPCSTTNLWFEVSKGKKYYKILQKDQHSENGMSSIVHAFVDTEGNVYKPAGWRGPAKIVRYNLLDEKSFASCLSKADWAGGYLYIK